VGQLKILLDTHIFLWWLFDDPKLPARIRIHIASAENEVLVSAASVWEIATKFRLGKLPEASSVAKNIPLWIDKAGFKALSVTPDHAQLAGDWKISHRDPFDRMLAAQSRLEKIALASVDKAMTEFNIDLINS